LPENLCHHQDERESFMESIIMGEETWIYELIRESKGSSTTLKHAHSLTTEELKTEISAKESNGIHVLGF
jgi:hypothetical protein